MAIVVMSLITSFQAVAQNFEWAHNTGSSSDDVINAIAIDGFGNSYSIGDFSGTVDFDHGVGVFNIASNGNSDVFIQKWDINGNFIWAKSVGGSGNDYGSAIAIDLSGNVYATGRFTGTVDFDPGVGVMNMTSNGSEDLFIQKLDPTGNLIWVKSLGGTGSDLGEGIAVDNGGNICVTGRFRFSVDFDPSAGIANRVSNGGSDIYVLKLDSNGNFLWAVSMGGATNEFGRSISVDAFDNIITTGNFANTVDFDPSAGVANLIGNTFDDIFIQKLDSNGNFIWAKSIGGAENESTGRIITDINNNLYITGKFQNVVDFDPGVGTFNLTSNGLFDVFIEKLDPNGNFEWVKTVGGSFSEEGASISLDLAGNIYCAGTFAGTVDFDSGTGSTFLSSNGGIDAFILKLDNTGNFIWVEKIGGSSGDGGLDIAWYTDNSIYTAGFFQGTVDFDPSMAVASLISAGLRDGFVQKLSQCTSSYSTDSQSACNTFTWIDGNTYTSSNNSATFLLTNAAGCDSVITLNLTINNSSIGTDVQTACDSYTWIDGNTYSTSNNSATFALTNAEGCDSIVTLNLTINNSVVTTDIQTACDSYTWTDGNTYTANNTSATQFLTSAAGCDSVVTLSLTITALDVSTSVSGFTISATTTGATYQWIDCSDDWPFIGETNQSFTPASNGDYAVIITYAGCSETSECVTINTIGITENDPFKDVLVYPNPITETMSVAIGDLDNVSIKIASVDGRIIYSQLLTDAVLAEIPFNEPSGIYYVTLESGEYSKVFKMIKK